MNDFETSEQTTIAYWPGRRQLVRLNADATVHVETDGEQVWDKVVRVVKRFDTNERTQYRFSRKKDMRVLARWRVGDSVRVVSLIILWTWDRMIRLCWMILYYLVKWQAERIIATTTLNLYAWATTRAYASWRMETHEWWSLILFDTSNKQVITDAESDERRWEWRTTLRVTNDAESYERRWELRTTSAPTVTVSVGVTVHVVTDGDRWWQMVTIW